MALPSAVASSGETPGGVAGPGDPTGLFGEAGGVGERAAGIRDVLVDGADGLLDPPRGGTPLRRR